MKLNSTIPSDLTITINDYPIGWEWLDKVPLEDFTWLIEIFATMTDNTDLTTLLLSIRKQPMENLHTP